MRIELGNTFGNVLYDPEALRDLLAEDEDPGRAFVRFPRRLEREIRAGNAWRLSTDPDNGDPDLLIDEPLPDRWRDPHGGRDEAWLRVPSGVLLRAGGGYEADRAPERVAEVPPGLYVIRRIIEGESEPPPAPDEIPAPEETLTREDRRIVRRFDRLVVIPVLLAGMTATVITLLGKSRGLWVDGLVYGGIVLCCTILVLVLRFPMGAHSALRRVETAEKERERLVCAAKAARRQWEEEPKGPIRELLVLTRREEPGR